MKRKKDFLNYYTKVFDDAGKMTNCGRSACIDLITKCNEIGNPNVYYGNAKTGFLDICEIKQLVIEKYPAIIIRETYFNLLSNHVDLTPQILVDTLMQCNLLPIEKTIINAETEQIYKVFVKVIENFILVRDYM